MKFFAIFFFISEKNTHGMLILIIFILFLQKYIDVITYNYLNCCKKNTYIMKMYDIPFRGTRLTMKSWRVMIGK